MFFTLIMTRALTVSIHRQKANLKIGMLKTASGKRATTLRQVRANPCAWHAGRISENLRRASVHARKDENEQPTQLKRKY